MIRDMLIISVFDYAAEHQFSISERMTIWQRNRLSSKVISDFMIYKEALINICCSLHAKLDNMNDINILLIDEYERTVSEK